MAVLVIRLQPHGRDEDGLDPLVEPGKLWVLLLVEADVLLEVHQALAVGGEAVTGNDIGLERRGIERNIKNFAK